MARERSRGTTDIGATPRVGAVSPSDTGGRGSGRASSAFYRMILDSLPDTTVFAFGPDLRYQVVAGAAVARIGWSPQELIGKLPADLLGEEQGALLEEQLRAALAGETRTFEHPGVRDADAHWASTVAPLVGDDGSVVGGLVISRNVAELRSAQDAVRQLESVAAGSRRTAEDERRHRERLEFVADINDVLADCVDRRDIMRAVTRAAVPKLGDWCSIYVLMEPGNPVPEMEVAHVDPELEESARRLLALLPYDPRAGSGMAEVIRTGQPRFYQEITDEAVRLLQLPEDIRTEILRLNLASSMAVPLQKRHRVIGGMQFILARGERTYTDEDFTLALAVAGRVAASLENRRLTELQTEIATTLQRSLLPDRLPSVPGADMAVRYWSAREGTEVGGDFYDVFSLGDTRHAVVVGDVCGSGPAAAAVTAMVRHTVRAHARRGDDHAGVLAKLNQAAVESWSDTFCTLAYATVEPGPDGLRVTLASAGHPLPVLARAGGQAGLVGRPGPLIGVLEEVAHPAVTFDLAPGDALVLYTDGANDLPPPDHLDDDELVAMVAAAIAATEDAEGALEALSAALHERTPFSARNDDVALVVVRATGAPPAGR